MPVLYNHPFYFYHNWFLFSKLWSHKNPIIWKTQMAIWKPQLSSGIIK